MLSVDFVRQAIAEAKLSAQPVRSFHAILGPAARFFSFRKEPGFITLPTANSWLELTRFKDIYFLSCLEITDESVKYANQQSAELSRKSKPLRERFILEEL